MKVPVTYSDRHAERLEIRRINQQIKRWNQTETTLLQLVGIALVGFILIAWLLN